MSICLIFSEQEPAIFVCRVLEKDFGFYFLEMQDFLSEKIINEANISQLVKKYLYIIKSKIDLLKSIYGKKNFVIMCHQRIRQHIDIFKNFFLDVFCISVKNENSINANLNLISQTILLSEANLLPKIITLKYSDKRKDVINRVESELNIQKIHKNKVSFNQGILPIEIKFNASVSIKIKEQFKNAGSIYEAINFTESRQDNVSFDSNSSLFKINNNESLKVKIECYNYDNNSESKVERFFCQEKNFEVKIKTMMLYFDIAIFLNKENNCAYVYARNNEIKRINSKTISKLVKTCINYIIQNRNKIILRKIDVIRMRNQAEKINQKYDKYFFLHNLYAKNHNQLEIVKHFVKTFDKNKTFSSISTFISTTLYRQKIAVNLPTIIFFPGTAHTRMLSETIDKESYKLATLTGCNVYTVNYRLSPENIYPVPLLDAYQAYQYLFESSKQLGLNQNKFILAGYSSGATLAILFSYLITLISHINRPLMTIAICPAVDFNYLKSNYPISTQIYDRYITMDFVRGVDKPYLSQFQDYKKPIISPLYMNEQEIKSLPPTLMLINKNDIYYSQQIAFCSKLEKFSSHPKKIEFAELDHCSWWDNQLQWELLSQYLRKNYQVDGNYFSYKNTLLSKDIFSKFHLVFDAASFLPISESNKENIIKINKFYNSALNDLNDLSEILEVVDKNSNCVCLQIYACTFLLSSKNSFIISYGEKYFNRLGLVRNLASMYENLLIDATLLAQANNFAKAIKKYRELLELWPIDILTIKIMGLYCIGISDKNTLLEIPQIINRSLRDSTYNHDSFLISHLLTMQAYFFNVTKSENLALSLCGQSLAIDPFNPFTQYLLADVYAKIYNPQAALAMLEKYQHTWKYYGNNVTKKNYFQMAMLYLKNGDYQNAYHLYKSHLKNDFLHTIETQVNHILLLWRFDLIENPNKSQIKFVTDNLNSIYQLVTYEHKLGNNLSARYHLFPYISLSYLYLCVRTGNFAQAINIKKGIFQRSKEKNWEIADKISDAIINFASNNYQFTQYVLKGCLQELTILGPPECQAVVEEFYHRACSRSQMLVTALHNNKKYSDLDSNQNSSLCSTSSSTVSLVKCGAFSLFVAGCGYALYRAANNSSCVNPLPKYIK